MGDLDVRDKIEGVLWGHAIGDALGVGVEGWDKEAIQENYPQGYSRYEQMDHFKRRKWRPGEWSDDTEQMLCIFDSILEKKGVDIRDIAKKVYRWAEVGRKGIGRTIANVVFSSGFGEDPHYVSKEFWERSGGTLAANGAVMRTSVLGIWKYWEEKEVIENAETVCRITHWDPRCVGSCVAVTYAISAILREVGDIGEIFQKALSMMDNYDKRIGPYLDLAKRPISELKLDEHGSMGYTLKSLSAGFWGRIQNRYGNGKREQRGCFPYRYEEGPIHRD